MKHKLPLITLLLAGTLNLVASSSLNNGSTSDADNEQEQTIRIANVEYDKVFKYVFSLNDDQGKKIVIDLLNHILGFKTGESDYPKITEVVALGDSSNTLDSSVFLFDLKCRCTVSKTAGNSAADDYFMDVEMQRQKHQGLLDRMVLYSGKLQSEAYNTHTQGIPVANKSKTQTTRYGDMPYVRTIMFLGSQDSFLNGEPVVYMAPSLMTGNVKDGCLDESQEINFLSLVSEKQLNIIIQLRKVEELVKRNTNSIDPWLKFFVYCTNNNSNSTILSISDKNASELKSLTPNIKSAVERAIQCAANTSTMDALQKQVTKYAEETESALAVAKQEGIEKGRIEERGRSIAKKLRNRSFELNDQNICTIMREEEYSDNDELKKTVKRNYDELIQSDSSVQESKKPRQEASTG